MGDAELEFLEGEASGALAAHALRGSVTETKGTHPSSSLPPPNPHQRPDSSFLSPFQKVHSGGQQGSEMGEGEGEEGGAAPAAHRQQREWLSLPTSPPVYLPAVFLSSRYARLEEESASTQTC